MRGVVHFEIHAEDLERASRFYTAVLGWQFTKWDGPVEYWLITTGPEEQRGIDGGMVPRRGPVDGQAATAYAYTASVENLDATLEKVLTNGGAIALPKMPVPGIGWLLYARDTEGNIFGMMQSDPTAGERGSEPMTTGLAPASPPCKIQCQRIGFSRAATQVSIPSIQLVPEFVPNPDRLFHTIRDTAAWDDRMRARRTATFGVPYNYSGMVYPESPLPPPPRELCDALERRLGFRPNNCLANYYADGRSRMGFHADSTQELVPGTGVAILSLGASRSLVLRRVGAWETMHEYRLTSGSLLYMPPEIQLEWKHGVPEEKGADAQISLTFRCLDVASVPEG